MHALAPPPPLLTPATGHVLVCVCVCVCVCCNRLQCVCILVWHSSCFFFVVDSVVDVLVDSVVDGLLLRG